VLLRVTCPPSRLPPLALVAGLAARDAIARAAPGKDVRIKWPNDVLVGPRRKKIAGVLVEAILQGRTVEALVIGIGVNVHARAFPDELADLATSIALETDRPADRAEVLADILSTLDRDIELVAARGLGLVHARLSSADALRGERVASDAGETGVAEGIDVEGRLLVRKDDGALARWGAGEVRLVARGS
jgi:BirA family biotin operon repressor/biotin-[acetyl-CoA-carboxylase] ligase